MKRIKFSTYSKDGTVLRQTSKGLGVWENCKFEVDTMENKRFDWWVVYDGIPKEEQANCNPENTIFVTGEPSSIKLYNKGFLKQFGYIITSQDIKGENVTHSQTALSWNIGKKMIGKTLLNFTKDYDELKAMPIPLKNKLLSVVTSNKSYTRGHRERLNFVRKLQEHFGNEIDVFGPGLGSKILSDQGIKFKYHIDKWDAIVYYKYHVVIENSSYKNYWTEKLADSYLAGSYPFYYGCPNLSDYFSNNAFTEIDINQPKKSIHIIEEAIRKNVSQIYACEVEKAKNLILDSYSIFPFLTDFINQNTIHENNSSQSITTIKPEKHFKKLSLLTEKARDFFIKMVK